MILSELVLTSESHIRHIASCARLSANSLTQVIHNDEMKTGTGFRACKRRAVLRKDPVKHFNEFKHAYNDAGFFAQLTRYARLQRFPDLQRTSWNRPLAAKRLTSHFPQTVELRPSDSMVPGRAFAAGQKVQVVARIARSGNPMAGSGDPFGEVAYLVGSDGLVNIVIDHLTP